jgi:arginase
MSAILHNSSPVLSSAGLPVSVIGAPCDVGANTGGAHLGPQAFRKVGLLEGLQAAGCNVKECGDLNMHEESMCENSSAAGNASSNELLGYKQLHAVMLWNHAVYEQVAQALKSGRLPVLLGGDHSLAMGSISAVAAHCKASDTPLRVVWFDAHADFNTESTSPTGNLHGMPLAVLSGQGPHALTHMAGYSPVVTPSQLRLLGVRSVDPAEQLAVRKARVPVFGMKRMARIGLKATMDRVLADVGPGTHVHVSLDVDCLDPQDAPGVSTPEQGGMALHALHYCLMRIAQTGCMGSLDVVELNPVHDLKGLTARRVRDVVCALFARHIHVLKRSEAVNQSVGKVRHAG